MGNIGIVRQIKRGQMIVPATQSFQASVLREVNLTDVVSIKIQKFQIGTIGNIY